MKAAVVIAGTLFAVACSDGNSRSNSSPTAPSASAAVENNLVARNQPSASSSSQNRIGFGVNTTVSGFPTGKVFLSGGGSFDRAAHQAVAGGGFRCLESVMQGPLSVSINPNDSGACLTGQGIRWDTASILDSTTFKCTGAQAESLKTAVTGDHVVVLQSDFYRASNGNNESFVAKIIVSDHDIAPDFPGMNTWVQNVGCGSAQSVNFSK